MRSKDYPQQLADYIKRNVTKGYTIDSLRWALVSQGHSRAQVDKAVLLANQQLAAAAPKIEKPAGQILVEPTQIEPEKKRGFWERLFG